MSQAASTNPHTNADINERRTAHQRFADVLRPQGTQTMESGTVPSSATKIKGIGRGIVFPYRAVQALIK